MSIHPSLKIDTAGAQQRTVLTRIERIKDLMKRGLWESGQRVTSLPKLKIVRVKAHKEKAEKKEEGAAAAPGAEASKTEAPSSTK